jgi:hypothetical protein
MQTAMSATATIYLRRLAALRYHKDVHFNWRGIRKLALASMFVTVTFIYMGQIAAWRILVPFGAESVYLAATPLSTIIALTVGIVCLWRMRIPYSIEITLVALVAAHWLEQQVIATTYPTDYSEWRVLFMVFSYASYAVLLFISYIAAYALFAAWHMRYRYKSIVAGVIICLIFASELIQMNSRGY